MMDIRHWGPGQRNTESLPNCINVGGGAFFNDGPVNVAELAFKPGGEVWEHSAPHPILFVVIVGEGFVRVASEETEVRAGDAVVWPPNVLHKAWTTDKSMTALAFEYDLDKK